MVGDEIAIAGVTREPWDGSAVVIDVIRAFTTAAAAFEAGASELICVADSDRARALRRSIPGALLMGEERGRPPAGFDFGNSPRQFAGMDLAGRTVVQRTSNGTRGLEMSAGGVLVASAAVNVSATARLVARQPPVRVVCTGEETSEDRACAEHLRSLLLGDEVNGAELSNAVLRAADEHRLLAEDPWTPEELDSHDADVRACAEVDRHNFAMVGHRTPEGVRLRRVVVQ